MIRTKNEIFDESIYYNSSDINVVKLQESMIEQLIETSRISESSRIIKIKSQSDLNIEPIQFSNKKKKEIELKQNQKVFNQLLTSKSEEIFQFSYIESSATSAKLATSRSLETAYQSLIERKTASIQELRSTIDETNIIFQRVSRIKRMKKTAHAITL